MKIPIRFQSRLLPRRSYKPERNPRRVGVAFKAANGFAILIAQRKAKTTPPARVNDEATHTA